MVTSQEIVERSFYISLLHQTLIRGLTINPENYLVKNEDGLWVPTRELNDQYIHDKEAIETELTKNGSGFYYIFGVGNNQSRGQKDLPRITLDLTAWYPGEIGLEKETNELDEASGLYQVIDYDYEPKSSRIDVHLCANNQQEMRILHEIMYKALPSRGYIKPYLNDYESWKNSKFAPSGNIYIEVGNFYDHDDLQQGFLEKVYTYEVRDSLLNPEIIAEIAPIADISVLIDSALTLHVPELPYEYKLFSNVDSIKFVPKSRYSYLSHTEPEDYEVDLGSTIKTGNKYVYYKETTIDPYIVPITITQNNQDVTDQCTFSFPTDKNIRMAYEDGNLIFTVKSIISTQFDAEVVVTKGDHSISIPFSVNFTIAIHGEIPNYVASDIFDVTKKLPLTLYGKNAGKGDILANGIWHGPSFTVEQDAPWPLNFGTLTVKELGPTFKSLFNTNNCDVSGLRITPKEGADMGDLVSPYISPLAYGNIEVKTDKNLNLYYEYTSGSYNYNQFILTDLCSAIRNPNLGYFVYIRPSNLTDEATKEAYENNTASLYMISRICEDSWNWPPDTDRIYFRDHLSIVKNPNGYYRYAYIPKNAITRHIDDNYYIDAYIYLKYCTLLDPNALFEIYIAKDIKH